MLKKMRATARELRQVSGEVRTEASRLQQDSEIGAWSGELAIDGLSQERVDDLVGLMRAELQRRGRLTQSDEPPRHDGLLRMTMVFSPGQSTYTNLTGSVGTIVDSLRRAGMEMRELRDCSLTVTLTPDAESQEDAPAERGLRRRLAAKTMSLAHGAFISAVRQFDNSVRLEMGDTEMRAVLRLSNLSLGTHDRLAAILDQYPRPSQISLDPAASRRLTAQMSRISGSDVDLLSEDPTTATVYVELTAVGTPAMGLLLLCDRMHDLFAAIPAGTSVQVAVVPA